MEEVVLLVLEYVVHVSTNVFRSSIFLTIVTVLAVLTSNFDHFFPKNCICQKVFSS